MQELICQNPQCQTEFVAKRSDARFCGDACKKAYSRSLQKLKAAKEEEQQKQETPLREEMDQLIRIQDALVFAKAQKELPKAEENQEPEKPEEPQPKIKSQAELKLEVEIRDWEMAYRLNDDRFYNIVLNPQIISLQKFLKVGESWIEFFQRRDLPLEIIQHIKYHWTKGYGQDQLWAINATVMEKKAMIPTIISKLKTDLKKLQEPENNPSAISIDPSTGLPPEFRYMNFLSLADLEIQLGENAKKIALLQSKLDSLKTTETVVPLNAPISRTKLKRKSLARNSYSPEELRNMEFDLIDLSSEGDLGAFLGDIESKMLAIALIGDPTAGKSTFSFRLAKLFMNVGKRVRYFSLEEGVTRLTSNKLDQAGIGNHDPFEVVGTGTLDEIRQAAKLWDVVILDSWSVLDEKPEEYNKLRADFPETIFIVIFQKTTSGTIRGGTKIIFDTPMCMNVYREGDMRMVEMQKSRYGTQNWIYSITEDEVVFDN